MVSYKSVSVGSVPVGVERQRKIAIEAAAGGQLDYAEREPHQVGPSPARQRGNETLVINAKNLQIKILRMWKPGQRVAHTAADQIGTLQLRRLTEDFLQFWRHEIHIMA